ncbi:META domain-containing protein [Kribbella turkmenica]|uniref:META domain-containing protein n=1 Tax=Kribbella turkmenica TaxID=2530375 RepID=A0A4V2YCW9_9ACTN|nr:META domain-containing protein [Kribbella turkmenica]TDD13086.1 META domain-containing protein [Kribbella turkmenica]
MSNSDLEDDLRGTFERAAASVPPATGLTERATTGARQAQRRTWIVAGAAAVAVAAVAVVGFSLGGRNATVQPPVAGGQTPAASASAQVAPSAETVSGTWRPVQMAGSTTLKADRPDEPLIEFKPDGTWQGSDGCNGLSGTYTIGQRGEFAVKIGPQRLVGCDNVPHTAVLRDAERIALDADTLKFFAGDGRELASYARAR